MVVYMKYDVRPEPLFTRIQAGNDRDPLESVSPLPTSSPPIVAASEPHLQAGGITEFFPKASNISLLTGDENVERLWSS